MRFKEYKNGGKAAGDRKTYAYNYLISKGVPSVQAAGIIGNLAAESGLNTTIIGKADDKKSVGLAQWHSERKTGLYNFAKKQGTGWDSLETQLDYILHELNTTEKRAKKSLFSAKTPQEATLAFMNDYERPAEWAKKQSSKERVNEALQLSGLKPDPNYTYNSEDKSTQQSDTYQFREIKSTDYYAPQVSQNISSLDNTQETTNLAEDKAAEIKNRLDQKKAEKAFIEQMIKATQVAYVNPEDYQSKPTFEEPQEQMFQQGGQIPVSSQGVYDFKTEGKVIKDNNGYWNPDNWGKAVEISSNHITMEGVKEPLYVVPDVGQPKLLFPNQNHIFPNATRVTEYPIKARVKTKRFSK